MTAPQKLWTVTVTTSPEFAEIISEQFGEDALAVSIYAPPRSDKAQIEAIYGTPPDSTRIAAQLSILAIINGVKPAKIAVKELPKLDWLKKVAADFPPLPIARWVVHGAAHRSAVPHRRLALQIDATNAFGTGEHPTTRGCLMMLDWLLKKWQPKHMLDMGCGSGILAMAYAQACHGKAVAVDLDPGSVQITKDNLRVNGLQAYVKTGQSYGYRSALVRQNEPYDLIMANIFARPLSEMAKDLKRLLRPGGLAILSGLLNHQANMVLAAHRMQGLYLVKHSKLNGWSVLACRSPGK